MAAPDPWEEGGTARPPLNRMCIAVLALIGFFVSLYLWAYHLGFMGEMICGVGDCAAVQASPWAMMGPVPVPAMGAAGYLILVGLASWGVQPAGQRSRLLPPLLFFGAAAGFLFSLWLTWLEAFVIRAWCQWCVVSAALITLIFLTSLPEVRRMRGMT